MKHLKTIQDMTMMIMNHIIEETTQLNAATVKDLIGVQVVHVKNLFVLAVNLNLHALAKSLFVLAVNLNLHALAKDLFALACKTTTTTVDLVANQNVCHVVAVLAAQPILLFQADILNLDP